MTIPAALTPEPAEAPTQDDLDIAQLAEYMVLDDMPAATQEIVKRVGRFRVNDDMAAEWAMRKLAAIEAQATAVEARAAEWVSEIEQWAAERTAPLAADHRYFEGLLIDYQRRRREADAYAKTLVLPSGKVTSRQSAPRPVVADPGAYCTWALELWRQGGPLLFSAKPAASTLREAAEIKEGVGVFVDAERVPGVVVEPAAVSYTVKVGK